MIQTEKQAIKSVPMQQNMQTITITDEKDAKLYINSLLQESIGSKPIELTLQAQLKVLTNLDISESSRLSLDPVDTMLQMLYDALRFAPSDDLKIQIQRQFASMIQNFVFFYEVSLMYSDKSQKKEATKLKSDVIKELQNSIGNVAKMTAAIVGKDYGEAALQANLVFENFMESKDDKPSLFDRICNYFAKRNDLEAKKNDFYNSLFNLSEKLGEHHEIIGRDARLSGLIKNRIDKMLEYKFKGATLQLENELNSYNPKCKEEISSFKTKIDWIIIGEVLVYILCVVYKVIVSLWNSGKDLLGFQSETSSPWFMQYSLIAVAICILLVIVKAIGKSIIKSKIAKQKKYTESKQNELAKERENCKQQLLKYANSLSLV